MKRVTVPKVVHPAQYSTSVVEQMVKRLDEHDVRGTVLDPFAGPGQSLVHFCAPRRKVLGIEIQPEWVDVGNGLLAETEESGVELRVGDATKTKLRKNSIAAVVTSPCYGNRFADAHMAADPSIRRSYTHDLRTMTGDNERQLAEGSAGTLRFGNPAYKSLHFDAYREMFRVLKPGAPMLLNVSDFFNNRERVAACAWHVAAMTSVGFWWVWSAAIETPRLRFGANRERVECEWLFEFRKPERT